MSENTQTTTTNSGGAQATTAASLLGDSPSGVSSIPSGGSGLSGQQATGGQGLSANEYEATDWRAALPPELRAEPSLKIMNDVSTMAKSYVHAQKMIGADKIPLPGKHATEQDWQMFYQKIGLPETPDKYDIKAPKDAKFVQDADLQSLKPLAHKLGILPKQLEPLLAWHEENMANSTVKAQEQFQIQRENEIKALEKEWGARFDVNISYAKNVIRDLQVPGLEGFLEETGLHNHPMMIKVLAEVGQKLYKEDEVVGTANRSATGVHTPEEALRKANEIVAEAAKNPKHPLSDNMHPNHNASREELTALFNQAYFNSSQG